LNGFLAEHNPAVIRRDDGTYEVVYIFPDIEESTINDVETGADTRRGGVVSKP
jgi:hypothetical protein